MKILGIKYGGHDTSAPLMIDGELVAACAKKGTKVNIVGDLVKGINDCLKIGEINLNDIDEIARSLIQPLKIYLKPAIKVLVDLSFNKDFENF